VLRKQKKLVVLKETLALVGITEDKTTSQTGTQEGLTTLFLLV
jgi:hypothetical protein